VAYEDLQNVDVMNGIARFLGVDETLEELDTSLKKQNPSPISAKVRNYEDMLVSLAGMDRFDLTRTPNFEPRRGPNVPSYVAAAEASLLYMPLRSGPQDQVMRWLAAVDGVAEADLPTKMNQKELRQWKRGHPGHRSFTVLRHPAARAHDAFCRHILGTGPGSYKQLRTTMIKRYNLPLPEDGPNASYDRSAHRTAFAAFLSFLKANLAGQTAIRVDPSWCTQSQALAGFAELCPPDRIIREETLGQELAELARAAGGDHVPALSTGQADQPYTLADIYDDEIEALAADAYHRDYVMFGFSRWAER
jgi:Sulfotransferase family